MEYKPLHSDNFSVLFCLRCHLKKTLLFEIRFGNWKLGKCILSITENICAASSNTSMVAVDFTYRQPTGSLKQNLPSNTSNTTPFMISSLSCVVNYCTVRCKPRILSYGNLIKALFVNCQPIISLATYSWVCTIILVVLRLSGDVLWLFVSSNMKCHLLVVRVLVRVGCMTRT